MTNLLQTSIASRAVSVTQVARQRPEKTTFRALNGLRFFAALSVVSFHYAPRTEAFDHLPGPLQNLVYAGPMALGFFYLLSGFVLAHAYVDRMPRTSASRRAFWLARVARLYPVYLLAFLLFLPISCVKYLGHAAAGSHGVSTFLLAGLVNVAALQAWTPIPQSWNGPSWSLSVEAFFYFLFPFVLRPLMQARAQRLIPLLAGLWACMLALSLLHVSGWIPEATWRPWIANNPLFWTPLFLAGVASYRLRSSIGEMSRHRAGLSTTVLLALVVLLFAEVGPVWREVLISGGAGPILACVIVAFSHETSLSSRALGTRVLFEAGAISYIVYILQAPVWHFFHAAFHHSTPANDQAPSALEFGLYLCVLMAFASLVSRFVEKPAQRWLMKQFGASRNTPDQTLPADPGSEAA